MNGIPHGRYSVRINEELQNLYFTQEEEQVKSWMWYQLAGGLRTWEKIFREKGYIPTGLGEARWERLSDAGGYAHLISAAAQYIFYLGEEGLGAAHHKYRNTLRGSGWASAMEAVGGTWL